LGKTLTPEQIEKLVDHVKVDNFSKNASVNMTMEIKSGFTNEGHSSVRKGITFHNINISFQIRFNHSKYKKKAKLATGRTTSVPN
jgi:hypothetical protein